MSSRLDEIRARWAAATPGPWLCGEGPTPHSSCVVESDITGAEVAEVHRRKDAAAIAAAPEDVAWLMAEVGRLRVREASWQESLRLLLDTLPPVTAGVVRGFFVTLGKEGSDHE